MELNKTTLLRKYETKQNYYPMKVEIAAHDKWQLYQKSVQEPLDLKMLN